jgi:Asp/Glu/hydantoin racemase
LLAPFIEAARSLELAGCTGIMTSCGFLTLFQDEIARAVGVPFASSSLVQLPAVAAGLPGGLRPGVLTISAESLGRDHLRGAGADPDTPVAGVASGGEFARAILGDRPEMNMAKLKGEVLEAGARLLADHADVGAIILECTNMPPYAEALRAATGLPVYDAITLANGLMARTTR